MHGPGPVTATNPTGWQPEYDQPIRVVDTFMLGLREDRREKWRNIRDAGFGLWPLEFTFEVLPPDSLGEYEVIPGAIRIIKGVAGHDSGGWIEPPQGPGGLMVLGPWPPWWKPYWFKSARGIVCHESGHCLGLWHRESGGVMAGGNKPDEHDLESIGAYYG